MIRPPVVDVVTLPTEKLPRKTEARRSLPHGPPLDSVLFRRCILEVVVEWRIVQGPVSYPLSVVVLFQIGFERFRQTQIVDPIVGGVADDRRSAQLLQGEYEFPVQRVGEHRLEEHHAGGIFVVLE